jgi:hypothetical protein
LFSRREICEDLNNYSIKEAFMPEPSKDPKDPSPTETAPEESLEVEQLEGRQGDDEPVEAPEEDMLFLGIHD